MENNRLIFFRYSCLCSSVCTVVKVYRTSGQFPEKPPSHELRFLPYHPQHGFTHKIHNTAPRHVPQVIRFHLPAALRDTHRQSKAYVWREISFARSIVPVTVHAAALLLQSHQRDIERLKWKYLIYIVGSEKPRTKSILYVCHFEIPKTYNNEGCF